jgi:hypothetical protein
MSPTLTANSAGGEKRLRLAVLTDHGRIPRFALEALDEVRGCDELSVFSCSNTRLKRRLIRHCGYYFLNALSVRNPLTRQMDIATGRKRISSHTTFSSNYDGSWQTLPDTVVEQLKDYDIILKFGMGLLRVPPTEVLPVPILSYHHGDPDQFRGRPAAFWEMVQGAPVVGQVVQRIGNRLDAGDIAAYAETRVLPHSYRSTLLESYRHSRLLINSAIQNALAHAWLPKSCSGCNYRLPSNWLVAKFFVAMAFQFAKRIIYGAVTEKKWQVSRASAAGFRMSAVSSESFPPESSWREIPVNGGFVFYADPFFASRGDGILVEALCDRTGEGEILLIERDEHRRLLAIDGHLSYPCAVEAAGRHLLIPEMAVDYEQKLFAFEEGELRQLPALRFEKPTRLIDPTLVEHDGRLYLFANELSTGASALFLWSAESLDHVFQLHPASPLLITPRGGRMAGNLVRAEGGLIRLGQTFLRRYGDGIVVYEVTELSATRYAEREIGELRFGGRNGPHTLNSRGGELVFDWYKEVFSPLAGLRRWRAHRRAATRQTLRPMATQ